MKTRKSTRQSTRISTLNANRQNGLHDDDEHRTKIKDIKELKSVVDGLHDDDGHRTNIKDIKELKSVVVDCPRAESYFATTKRIRFQAAKAVVKEPTKVKETKTKVKRPRKGNRQGIDKTKSKLPVAPDFSVTSEVAKIPADAVCDFPWVTKNQRQLTQRVQEIEKDFPRWLLYLREGFNVMLYGYGSKRPIFDSLQTYIGKKFVIVSINGLFRQFNPSIARNLVETLSAHKSHDPAFIFVMNFDVLAIRHPKMLTALCTLTTLPFIHLVASSDHINAGLGISPVQARQLNFAWFDCTTLQPYCDELIWNASPFGESSNATTAQHALEHMFKSITTNAKTAFGILAKLQLQKTSMKKQAFRGVEFNELSRRCREAFVAHSDLVLKTLLSEFVDHKLITYSGKGKNDDNLTIELDEETLKKYAQN